MPITGKVKLCKDLILSRAGEEDIYRFYIGTGYKLGTKIRSPMHKDENPSFSVFVTKEGTLHHTDFATGQSGNCIDLVMQMFNLSFYEALKKINHDFSLDIETIKNKKEYQKTVNTPTYTYTPKKETIIQVVSGKFSYQDLDYWAQYHLSEDELKANLVYPVKKLFLNGEAFLLPPGELVFGYLYDEKWKIYRPHADKKHKWMTNVPLDQMSGLERIKEGTQSGIVTKSKKDEMVLAKFLPAVCSTQNESASAINVDNLKLLNERCKEVYVNFDNDEVGVEASKYYNQFGFRWVNVPKDSQVKDFADMARVHGMNAVINYFKHKKLM